MWWEEKKWESTRGDTTVAPDLAQENKKNGAKRLGSQSTTHKPHAIGRRKERRSTQVYNIRTESVTMALYGMR